MSIISRIAVYLAYIASGLLCYFLYMSVNVPFFRSRRITLPFLAQQHLSPNVDVT
jgi:hypothetical protein